MRLRILVHLLALVGCPLVVIPAEPGKKPAAEPLLLVPKSGILVRCGFVPCAGNRHLHACLVGTPSGTHYAYDFETGVPFMVWRGGFADMSKVWNGAGLDQVVEPAGHATVITTRPAFAFFPNRLFTLPSGWPERSEALYRFHGYELEQDGQPVFLASLEKLEIRDRIAPLADGRGLERSMTFSGSLSPWETWVLLGEGRALSASAGGWVADGGTWWIDWPAEAAARPVVRAEGDRQLLALKLGAVHLKDPVRYRLMWK